MPSDASSADNDQPVRRQIFRQIAIFLMDGATILAGMIRRSCRITTTKGEQS
jgi:hypothetical protein